MDTLIDPDGVEALFERIVNDKLSYWDALIDWAIETGNEHKIQVISECDDLGSQTTTIIDPDFLRENGYSPFQDHFCPRKKTVARCENLYAQLWGDP